MPLKCIEHFLDQIVNVQKLQLGGAVAHGDWQIICHIVAEGRHGAVVVGAAPLAEQIRETVDQHRRAGGSAVVEEQFLARKLAFAVVTLAVAAEQGRLNRAGQHDRAGVAVGFERVQQGGGKAEVALHELVIAFGAVDARKVKDKIGLGTEFVQRSGGCVKVVLKHLIHGQGRAGTVLAVAEVLQIFAEVAAHKALGAGHENFHAFFSASISFSALRTYSVVRIFLTVPSTSRRFVLWLV